MRARLRGMGKTSMARVPDATPQDRARAERRAKLLEFFADPPPEVLAAAEAVGRAREHYGDDTDRELADLEAGRHLLQRTKTAPSR
jgi:hypothetical protein